MLMFLGFIVLIACLVIGVRRGGIRGPQKEVSVWLLFLVSALFSSFLLWA